MIDKLFFTVATKLKMAVPEFSKKLEKGAEFVVGQAK